MLHHVLPGEGLNQYKTYFVTLRSYENIPYMFQVYNLEETFAVSSQWMNRNNYRVILEEILTINKQLRASLPKDVDSYTPAEKVMTLCT